MPIPFFEEPSEHSLVKAEIVVAYFERWANIMALKSDPIAYADLYAGPGRYESGQDSVPMLVLKIANKAARLQKSLVARFNDVNPDFAAQLRTNIDGLEGVQLLRHKPIVTCEAVGDRIAALFDDTRLVPTLTFLDPWGYVGLSRKLIAGALKDYGCEVIFFFNYSRITGAVVNPKVEAQMEAFFSSARLDSLQRDLAGLPPEEREHRLMREVGETVTELGAKYIIPFRFSRSGGRQSHYIVFATKHPKGYEKMKDVMADKGICDVDGVPQFEYLPTSTGRQLSFDSGRPILGLPNALLSKFRGRTLAFQKLFDEHQVGTPFVMSNYKQILLQMEAQNIIEIEKRPKGTLAPTRRVTFGP